MSLKKFLERMGQPLAKSVHPDDFTAFREEHAKNGPDVVNHIEELKSHPPDLQPKVEEYRKAISGDANLMRISPTTLHGVSPKNVYRMSNSTNLPAGDMLLVKPYHEALHPKTKFWMRHPIQGWAEMTNQHLWHAAGMGDMHQRVHVSEHNMGPGFEKNPAVVVHTEPDTDYVENLDYKDFDESMADDAAKIGVMDFLSNNIDRHRRNLLFRKQGALNAKGAPYASRLLAIDHGRSFQYHAAHKGVPEHIEDPFLGMIPVEKEVRDSHNKLAKETDNLIPYLRSDALMKINGLGREFGLNAIYSGRRIPTLINRWWPSVRDNVIAAFVDRLRLIKEPRMKEHLFDNFKERVAKLDDIATRADWYANNAKMPHMDVPLKVWDR